MKRLRDIPTANRCLYTLVSCNLILSAVLRLPTCISIHNDSYQPDLRHSEISSCSSVAVPTALTIRWASCRLHII
ncbi:hypothetical protein HZ326_30602 [Fusarium oxysporum f. sp. albedinis]|nr:hypothetical protein HZ326_30602 [Fusarium oxysporum f. sp. albedinis]